MKQFRTASCDVSARAGCSRATDQMRMSLDVDDGDVVELDVQELIDRLKRALDLHAVLELDADLHGVSQVGRQCSAHLRVLQRLRASVGRLRALALTLKTAHVRGGQGGASAYMRRRGPWLSAS